MREKYVRTKTNVFYTVVGRLRMRTSPDLEAAYVAMNTLQATQPFQLIQIR